MRPTIPGLYKNPTHALNPISFGVVFCLFLSPLGVQESVNPKLLNPFFGLRLSELRKSDALSSAP